MVTHVPDHQWEAEEVWAQFVKWGQWRTITVSQNRRIVVNCGGGRIDIAASSLLPPRPSVLLNRDRSHR